MSCHIATLTDRLLHIGGTTVGIDPLDEDLAALATSGAPFDDRPVIVQPGAPSQCHRNSADLCRDGKARVATGYALSEDGHWRYHSWGIDADGAIIETTLPRTRYYGIVLDDDAAAEFCFFNV